MRSLADDGATAWHLQCPYAPTVALAPDHFRAMIRLELGLGPTPNGDPRRPHAIMNSRHGNQGGSRTRIHDDIAKVLNQCARSCDGSIAELEVRHRLNYDHGGPARPDLILDDVGPGTLTDRRDHPNGIAVDVVTAHPVHSDGNVNKATARTKGKAAADAFNGKVRKYGDAPEREGMEFIPFALDTFGLLHPKSHELLKRLARRNAETVTNIRRNDSVPAHAGRTYERWLRTLSITRARAVGAFITGGIAQANRYARAEALANAADSHVLDAL